MRRIVFSLFFLWSFWFFHQKAKADPLEWQTISEGAFSISMKVNPSLIKWLEQVEVTLKISYPMTYLLEVDSLQSKLLFYNGLAIAPFNLLAQKRGRSFIPQDRVIDTISYTLEANQKGHHFLTFYSFLFIPLDPSKNKRVELISPIYPLKVEEQAELFSYPEKISAPLMDFSKALPVNLDESTQAIYRQNEETKKNQELISRRQIPMWQLSGFVLLTIFILTFKRKSKTSIY